MNKINYCQSCQKEFGIFRWRYSCGICNKIVCDDCLRGPPYYLLSLMVPVPVRTLPHCPDCFRKEISPFIEKYKKAQESASLIEVFPNTYKGKILFDESLPPIKLSTSCSYRNRDSCDEVLKINAAYLGYDTLIEREYVRDTEEESTGKKGKGTYYYSVWGAKAVAIKRK